MMSDRPKLLDELNSIAEYYFEYPTEPIPVNEIMARQHVQFLLGAIYVLLLEASPPKGKTP